MSVGVYFEWNVRAHKAMTDRLLEELLGTVASDTPVEFGSNILYHLSPTVNLVDIDNHSSFCIPAVPTECVGLNAESPTDDLMQASQLFVKEEEEEEDSLLLAASQQYV